MIRCWVYINVARCVQFSNTDFHTTMSSHSKQNQTTTSHIPSLHLSSFLSRGSSPPPRFSFISSSISPFSNIQAYLIIFLSISPFNLPFEIFPTARANNTLVYSLLISIPRSRHKSCNGKPCAFLELRCLTATCCASRYAKMGAMELNPKPDLARGRRS